MIKRNGVRYFAALIAILLVVGLVDYAHLEGARRHTRPSSASHTPSVSVAPALPACHTSCKPRRASPTLAAGHQVTAAPRTKEQSPVTARPMNPVRRAPALFPSAVGLIYVVQPGDTLWHLSAVYLGNPVLWTKLFALNRGRNEPDGRAFVDPNRIYPGWTIQFPVGPTGLRSFASNESAVPHVAPANPATQTLAPGAPTRNSSQ
jgi:hypothetical protein